MIKDENLKFGWYLALKKDTGLELAQLEIVKAIYTDKTDTLRIIRYGEERFYHRLDFDYLKEIPQKYFPDTHAQIDLGEIAQGHYWVNHIEPILVLVDENKETHFAGTGRSLSLGGMKNAGYKFLERFQWKLP